MSRKTTEADKKYITDNWLKMLNKDIASNLGIDPDYLTVIAKRLGLPSKKNLVCINSVINKKCRKRQKLMRRE